MLAFDSHPITLHTIGQLLTGLPGGDQARVVYGAAANAHGRKQVANLLARDSTARVIGLFSNSSSEAVNLQGAAVLVRLDLPSWDTTAAEIDSDPVDTAAHIAALEAEAETGDGIAHALQPVYDRHAIVARLRDITPRLTAAPVPLIEVETHFTGLAPTTPAENRITAGILGIPTR